jgi:hypothetical protein
MAINVFCNGAKVDGVAGRDHSSAGAFDRASRLILRFTLERTSTRRERRLIIDTHVTFLPVLVRLTSL